MISREVILVLEVEKHISYNVRGGRSPAITTYFLIELVIGRMSYVNDVNVLPTVYNRQVE